MNKKFNITGVCIPHKHYMVNISRKIKEILKLIEGEEYFTINRSRQYGKTTTLHQLYLTLRDKYLVIEISFEGLGDHAFTSENEFCESFINLVSKRLHFQKVHRKIIEKWEENKDNLEKFEELSTKITNLVEESNKEVLLFIDEVDKSSDNQLFLHFLGMLRTKYLDRDKGMDSTFKSVILAGVHDIKTLKIKLRQSDEKKYNSPWNIATEFKVNMSFDKEEISTMLLDYENDNNTGMDIKKISEEIYKNTSGYPFLVSKICKVIDEELDKTFTVEGIQKAINIILKEKNTLFDDLIKNLENNNELYKLVYNILIAGKQIEYNIDNPIINIGIVYGILSKNSENNIKAHNKIFETRIYNYMISKLQTSGENKINYETTNQFIDETNNLNIEKVLLKFQELRLVQKNN